MTGSYGIAGEVGVGKVTQELLPCPFCGGPAELRQDVNYQTGEPLDTAWFAICGPCDLIRDQAWSVPRDTAIEQWNTRTNNHAELVEALCEAETVFALVEHPAFPDPDYQARIEALGSQIGYGALMAGASAAWRKSNIVEGSEFVAGPCQITVTRTLEMIRKALSLYTEGEKP